MGKNNKQNNKKTKWEYKGKKDLVIPLDASPWEVLQMVGVPVNPHTLSYKIRPLNAKYGVKNSWHKVPWKGSKVYGSAVDLTPAPGYTYEDIFKALAHPEVLKWAKHNGFGLHDERTKAALAKTNGTGFHVHFGPNRTNLTVNPFITPYFSYWQGLGMGNTASVVAPDNIPQSTDIYVQDPQYQQLPYVILPEQQDFDWSTLTSDVEEEYVPVNAENTNSIALYLLPYLFSDLRLNDFIKPKEDGIKIRISANGGKLNLFGKGSKIKSKYKSDNDWELMYELSKPIYQQFIDADIDPLIAVGILGNIALESSFNHKASNKTHWGYVQNDRNLRDYVMSNYGGYGPEQQIQYLIDGLTKGIKGSDKGRGKAIQKRFTNFLNAAKGITDPADIAKLWDDYYEISGGLALYDRRNYATKFWSRYNVPKTQQITQQIVQETPLMLLFLRSPLNIAAIYTEPLVRQPIELVKQQPSTLQLAMMMADPDLYTAELDGIDLVKELFEPLGIKHTNKKEDNSEEHNYKIKMSFADGGMLNVDKDAIMSDYDTWAKYMSEKTDIPLYNFYGDDYLLSIFNDNPEEAYEMVSSSEEHPILKEWMSKGGIVNKFDTAGQIATGNINPNFNLLKLPTFMDFNNPNNLTTLNDDYETIGQMPLITVVPDLNLRNRVLKAYPNSTVRSKVLTALNDNYDKDWNGIIVKDKEGNDVTYRPLYSPNLGIERLLNMHALAGSPEISNSRELYTNALSEAIARNMHKILPEGEHFYEGLPNGEFYKSAVSSTMFGRPIVNIDYELLPKDFLHNLISEYSHPILKNNFPNYFDINHQTWNRIVDAVTGSRRYDSSAYHTPGELERYTHLVVDPYFQDMIFNIGNEAAKQVNIDSNKGRELKDIYETNMSNSADLDYLHFILNKDIENNPPDENEYSDFWKKYYKQNPNSNIKHGAGVEWKYGGNINRFDDGGYYNINYPATFMPNYIPDKFRTDKLQLANDALKFVTEYTQSPGFKERLNKSNDILRNLFMESQYDELWGRGEDDREIIYRGLPETLNNIRDAKDLTYEERIMGLKNNAWYNNKQIDIGDINFNNFITGNYGETAAHELGHALDEAMKIKLGLSYTGDGYRYDWGLRYSNIFPVFRKGKAYTEFVQNLPRYRQVNFIQNPQNYEMNNPNGVPHDAKPSESYADLLQLRYELQKAGIYDNFKANNPATIDTINLYRESKGDGKLNRLFDNFKDEDIVDMLNTVAQNNPYNNNDFNLNPNAYNITAMGGPVNKYGSGSWMTRPLQQLRNTIKLWQNSKLLNSRLLHLLASQPKNLTYTAPASSTRVEGKREITPTSDLKKQKAVAAAKARNLVRYGNANADASEIRKAELNPDTYLHDEVQPVIHAQIGPDNRTLQEQDLGQQRFNNYVANLPQILAKEQLNYITDKIFSTFMPSKHMSAASRDGNYFSNLYANDNAGIWDLALDHDLAVQFSKNYPILSLTGNLATDLLTAKGITKGINFTRNAANLQNGIPLGWNRRWHSDIPINENWYYRSGNNLGESEIISTNYKNPHFFKGEPSWATTQNETIINKGLGNYEWKPVDTYGNIVELTIEEIQPSTVVTRSGKVIQRPGGVRVTNNLGTPMGSGNEFTPTVNGVGNIANPADFTIFKPFNMFGKNFGYIERPLRQNKSTFDISNMQDAFKKAYNNVRKTFTLNQLNKNVSSEISDYGKITNSTPTAKEPMNLETTIKNVAEHAKKEILLYLESDNFIQRIMKDGISKQEATLIANEMYANAAGTAGPIVKSLEKEGRQGKHSNEFGTVDELYNNGPKTSIQLMLNEPESLTFKPSYYVSPYAEDYFGTIYHELGGHGATIGYDPSYILYLNGINKDLGKRYSEVMLDWFPHYLTVYNHNLALKPVRRPEYQSSLSDEVEDYIKYLENVDEYSARARATLIDNGYKLGPLFMTNDFKHMFNYFTKESLEKLLNNVWGVSIPIAVGTALDNQ